MAVFLSNGDVAWEIPSEYVTRRVPPFEPQTFEHNIGWMYERGVYQPPPGWYILTVRPEGKLGICGEIRIKRRRR